MNNPLLTATGKEAALERFKAQLSRDGMTLEDLAVRARVGRSHLSQVIHGHGRGRHTWKHLLPCLSEAAVSELEQCSAWNTYAAAAWREESAARRLKLSPSNR